MFILTDIKTVYQSLGEFELLLTSATDLLDSQIESVLREMSVTPLCGDLEVEDPIPLREVVERTQKACTAAAHTLAKYDLCLLYPEIYMYLFYSAT